MMFPTETRMFPTETSRAYPAVQVDAPNAQRLGIFVNGRIVTIAGVPHTVTHGIWRDLLGLTRKPPVNS